MRTKGTRRWWQRPQLDDEPLPWLTPPSDGDVVFDSTLRTAGELVAEKRRSEPSVTPSQAA